MKQIADTASPRFHVSPVFAFMDFNPLSASPPLSGSTDGREKGGNAGKPKTSSRVCQKSERRCSRCRTGEKIGTNSRRHCGALKRIQSVWAIVEISHRQKIAAVRGREPCTGTEGALIYREVFWLSLNSLARSAGLLQSPFLLLGVRRIVNTFQSLSELSKCRLQLPELGVKVGFLEVPFFAAHVALSRIIKVQLLPGDAMLVQVDPVHSPHEHEAHAALLAELVHERVPIELHFPINLTTSGAPAARCFARPLAEPFRLAPA